MIPDKDELKEIAAKGNFKRIPLCMEIYSDAYTPIEAMRILREQSNHCFLLESASQTENWGRYTFLGYKPTLEVTCIDGHLTVKQEHDDGTEEMIHEEEVSHPGEYLRELISSYRSPQINGMPPFTGGLVGYFSYDYIKYAEPKLKLSKDADDFKDMDLMLFNDVIAFDHYRQKIYLISGVRMSDIDKSYDAAVLRINEMNSILKTGKKHFFEPLKLKSEILPVKLKEEYVDMVEKAKKYIREGDIFQVVLSDPLTAKAEGSLFDTYRVLRAKNPSPYMFYFTSDDIEMAGASPETLASLQNGIVSTFPLAGTRRRGKNFEEDQALERELLSDEKELAEHNMLVDLGRNDIGRVSKLGSVNVEKYMEIERFSRVMHIGSTVTGQVRDDMDAVDCIDAILPAGTLSGAPKFRACQIIEELEGRKRGVYGGAVGYLDFSGNMDVCIAIRLVYKKNGEICIRSGAGIVADSIPENEFMECQNKAAAVVDAVKTAEYGLDE